VPELSPDDTLRVSDAARGHPGASYAALASVLGSRRAATLALLRTAVDQGVLYEGPSRVAVRRPGATRAVRGLFAEPPAIIKEPAAVDVGPEQLREYRGTLGVSAARVARHLGVSVGQLYHWEQGRQSVPEWALQRFPEALERASEPDPPSRRRSATHRNQLLREVRANPGQSRTQLAAALGITRQTLRMRLAPVLAAARVHEAAALCPDARGRLRASTSVFPGPAPAPAPTLATRDLAHAARAAGWSGARVARALGVNLPTWYAYVRADRPVPTWAQSVPEVLATMLDAARRLERDLLEAMATRPTREQFTRGTFGRSTAVESALARLLDQDRAHSAYVPIQNAAGVTRQLEVLQPGPAPEVEPLDGPALTALRRSRGLSRPQLAKQVDISHTVLQKWEAGQLPINPGRAEQLRAHLETLPLAAQRRTDTKRHTDAELESAALAALHGCPGLSRRQLVARIPGDIRRRHALVRQLVASGRVEERQQRSARGDGVTYTAAAFYPPGASR